MMFEGLKFKSGSVPYYAGPKGKGKGASGSKDQQKQSGDRGEQGLKIPRI